MEFLFLLHVAATFSLFGLIWTVQLVHYPMFAGVRPEEFGAWHKGHASRISLLVGPLMGIEAITAILLCLAPPAGVPVELAWLGFGLVLLHLLSTAFLQVPLHRRLTRGFDARVVRRLVRTNWLRTLVWTARAALVLLMLGKVLT